MHHFQEKHGDEGIGSSSFVLPGGSGSAGRGAAGGERGANVILFGHTHEAYLHKDAELTVMNPGAAHFSYGVIDVAEDGSADIRVEDVPADFRKI